jgi:hypothetical protein
MIVRRVPPPCTVSAAERLACQGMTLHDFVGEWPVEQPDGTGRDPEKQFPCFALPCLWNVVWKGRVGVRL